MKTVTKLFDGPCPVCGGVKLAFSPVLWPKLVADWQLAPYEVDYINYQQGYCCCSCGNNLRSMALANAITSTYRYMGTLTNFLQDAEFSNFRILEINEAGGLTSALKQHPGHRLVCYPEYDIMRLKIESESFDIVIHSDTLEHVVSPVTGLSECKRILRSNGNVFFTIPIIVDRLTRSRSGLENSYHGSSGEGENALIVHTEYGSDFWKQLFLAGFSNYTMHCLQYPSGFAISAKG